MTNEKKPKRKFLISVTALAALTLAASGSATAIENNDNSQHYSQTVLQHKQSDKDFILEQSQSSNDQASYHYSHRSHSSHSSHKSHVSHQSHYSGWN